MTEYTRIEFEKADGVARITLNRPDNANGIDMTMAHELLQASIYCDEDEAVRAVLLTGKGKMFCAGGDLKSFSTYYDEGIGAKLKELTAYLHGAISRFSRMDAPLIVAVNGVAAGAGFSLAAVGDMVLASESAKFTMAYTAAGLSPDGSSSYFLPRIIGLRRTQELMLTNRILSAEEALQWGVVSRVLPDDNLVQAAEELASKFAAGPTRSYGVVKKLLHSSFGNGLETQMEIEASHVAAMAGTADGREGVSAFAEKRQPDYKGK